MGTLADLERIQWLKAAASLVLLITRGISPQTDLSCHGVEGRGRNGRGSGRRGRGWKEIGTSAV